MISSGQFKHVLITGGCGFIGSHLAEALLNTGHQVTVIDNLSTGRFENIQHLVKKWSANTTDSPFRFAIDDISNEAVLDRLVSECDIILHLAAAVGVRLIVENPVQTIETNVNGTETILKTALRYRAKVLLVSTSEVYGKGNHIPFREDDDVVLGPTSRSRWGYAASKMVDEFLALGYYEKKGLPVVICRLFNTVGPRQTGQYGMVVPSFVEQALQGKPLSVTGDGQQSRCFLHVQDAIKAIIGLAACNEAEGQVFNVGSQNEETIEGLARKVLKIVDETDARSAYMNAPDLQHGLSGEERIVLVPYEEAYAEGFEDMRRRKPDITKIQACIGWAPELSLEQIILDVIDEFIERNRSKERS